MRLLITSLFILLAVAGSAAADELRPGFLELKTSDGSVYSVKWKVPMKGGMVLHLQPILPESCRERTPPSRSAVTGAMITHWSVHCESGLTGEQITINGLEHTATDVLARVTLVGGMTQMARLTPRETGFIVSGEPSIWEVVTTYLMLGTEHILLGIDHLLFVFTLLLIVRGWRLLIGTITAFTIAHSITLATATLGYVHVPQAPVEAVIALSILFLASEIIHGRQGKTGLAQRYPWMVAFIFGLLHGFGFAGALSEVGLPPSDIPIALLFFNVGVEAGQLVFVSAVLLSGIAFRRLALQQKRWGEIAVTYTIGSVAAFWTIERVASFYV